MDNEMLFIVFNMIGIVVSLGYFVKRLRPSGLVTIVLAFLPLIKVTWVRWTGVVLIGLITICFLLFQTTIGAFLMHCLGRDRTGRKK